MYTAMSRKVVGKSARDNPEMDVVGFEFIVLSTEIDGWSQAFPCTYT